MKSLTAVLLLFACIPCFAQISVSGRIVNQNKAPVAKAEVTLSPILNPLQRAQPEMYTQGKSVAMALSLTNESGDFHFQAPSAGLWLLRVDAAGYVPQETVLMPLLEDYDSDEVILSRDEHIDVQVLDLSRKPIEGALVRAEDQDQRDYVYGKPWKRSIRTQTTGSDGKARLPRAAGEGLLVSVSAAGFAFQELQNIHSSVITLSMSSGKDQTVLITDSNGAAVPGVLLALGDSGYPADISNGNGEAKAVIAAGKSVEAMLFSPDGRSYKWNWTGVEEQTKPYAIRLPKRSGIRGRIVDAETGRAIPTAFVWDTTQRWNHSEATSGEYRLTLAAGSPWIRCNAAGYVQKDLRDLTILQDSELPLTIALQPAAALEGIVLDPQEQPVPRAELLLESGIRFRGQVRYWPQMSRKLRAAKDGKFRVSGLDVEGVYRLTAQSQVFSNASAEFEFSSGSQKVKGIRLQLKNGFSARGSVVDSSEAPIPDAAIKVFESPVETTGFMMPIETPELRNATADQNGAFQLQGLAPGKFDLQISAPRFATKRIPGVEIKSQDQPQDLGRFVLNPGAALMGRVQDQQKHPVQGAQIRIGPADPNGYMGILALHDPNAVSSEDGSFQIADQSEGTKVDVLVKREGYLDLELSATTVSATEPLILTLKTASQIFGKITGESGQPIAGAEVNLMHLTRENLSQMGISENSKDDGTFVLKAVPPDTYSLAAKAPGWQDTLQEGVVVVEGKDTTGVKITMSPEALLEGAVTTPDGKPAIGAVVQMSVQNERFNRGQRSSATSDGEGSYQLHGLKPGTANIQVSLEQYPPLQKEVEIKTGTNHMDFQLTGGSDISGRVIDETGSPVEGASLMIGQFFSGNRTSTDANGSFTLKGVPDGDQQLRVDKQGLTPDNEKNIVHVEGAPVPGVVIQMHHGAELSGNILGLDANQFAQVIVEAWKMPDGFFQAHVDEKGVYRLSGLAAGRWFLTASIAGGSSQATGEIAIENGVKQATLDLKFGEGLQLKGIVVRGNEPQAGVRVSVAGKDTESYGYSATDAAGKFQFDGLQRGEHTVTVASDDAKLNYKQTVDLQSDQDIVIRIPESVIRGKITDASDGAAIAGASITVFSTSAEIETPSAASSSAADGSYEVKNVAAGDWKVSFKKDGYAPVNQMIHMEPDQEMGNVNVALQPAEGLTLQIQMLGGQIPQRVVIGALDASGNPVLIRDYATGESGKLELKSLPAGKWELLAYSYGSAVTDIFVTAPQPGPVAVVLSPGGTVHVRVPALVAEKVIAKAIFKSPEGKIYRTPSAWIQQVRSEFELYSGELEQGLPPGTWTVEVTAPDGRKWSGSTSIVVQSSTDLVLQ